MQCNEGFSHLLLTKLTSFHGAGAGAGKLVALIVIEHLLTLLF